MKISKSRPLHWLLLLRQGFYTLLGIAARLLCRTPARPRVVLYGHQLSGNLKAIYEEWQRSFADDIDCHFLSLDPEYFKTLDADGVNALRCGSLLDMLWVGRSNAIITDHGLHAMQPMIALTDILFIDVWHGIPFKGFTPEHFKLQHKYSEIWVSSERLRNLYVERFGFPENIVLPMGYARVDKLFQGLPATHSFKELLHIAQDTKLVLYAPTWKQEDGNRELFPFGESQTSFIEKLSDACKKHSAILVIRSHLNATIGERQHKNVVYCSMKTFPDAEALLQETDILICDWSSIAFDYLALDRPAIFLDVPPPFNSGFSLGPGYRYGKVVAAMDELVASLERILDNATQYHIQHGKSHREICHEVYGDNTDGQSAHRQWQRLRQQIQN